MNFYLIGVDYQSAKIKIREKLLGLRRQVESFWQDKGRPFAVLSTCNRFEIYSVSPDVLTALRERNDFYEKFSLWGKSYFLSGKINVFRHILRLMSGLESQLKGEAQILQQMVSLLASREFPGIFKEIWHKALIEAIDIRMLSGLENKEHNIADLIFKDLRKKYPEVNSEVIIAGTGNIAKLFAQQKPRGLRLNFVSTKHRLRAKKLAEDFGAKAIGFKELPVRLVDDADFLITATLSPHFILKEADLSKIISRRLSPLYIYDLALPRAVEPEIRSLKNIILQDLDNLIPLFEIENLKLQEELKKAECLIEERVKQYEKDTEIRDKAKSFSFAAG